MTNDELAISPSQQTQLDLTNATAGLTNAPADLLADLDMNDLAEAPLGGLLLPTATSYKFYEIRTPRKLRSPLLVFTPASANRQAPTRIFRQAADVEYRHVWWIADRIGEWPEYPAVDESQGRLMDMEVTPMAPVVQGTDGIVLRFRLVGHYRYVLKQPGYPQDPPDSGKVPYLAVDDDQLEVDEDLQEDLGGLPDDEDS